MRKLLLFTFFIVFGGEIYGQEISSVQRERDSLEVVDFMTRELYNEAVQFLNARLEVAQDEPALTPFLLWLKSQKAYALNGTSQEEAALKEALEVIALAEPEMSCAALVDARLTIALIQEIHELGESCLEELNRVKALLGVCGLPAARSRYHVRKSSYHRWFGNPDSIAYHAKLAIEFGKKSGFQQGVLDGNFMLAVANKGEDEEAVYFHLAAMANLCKEMGRLPCALATQVNLAKAKQRGNLAEEALDIANHVIKELAELNDSSLLFNPVITHVYFIKYELLNAKGDYPGAMDALQQWTSKELSFRDTMLSQRVKDVEARYQSQLKDEALLKRESELAAQKDRARFIWIALVAAIISAMLLISLVIRLRKAKRALEDKSNLLLKSNDKLAGSLAEQVVLRSELHHRVKNNLQVIISLLNLQEHKTGDEEVKDSLRTMSERVYSIAAVHELLYPSQNASRLSLAEYTNMLCHHSAQLWPSGHRPEFLIDVGDRSFNLDTLVPLGVILSELLTNTRKNFGDSAIPPRISIQLHKLANGLRLTYQDNGPGFLNGQMTERDGGLGKYLLKSMSRQLNGHFETANTEGALTTVFFQVKNDDINPESPVYESVQALKSSTTRLEVSDAG